MRKNTQISTLLLVFSVFLSLKSLAQNCFNTTNYPSGTITISSTGTTNVTGCNYAGEYSVDSFTAAGIYSISASGGTSNYITVTDNSNNPIGAGYSLLGVVIPTVGVYRIHISTGPNCATESACRSVNVWLADACTNTVQNPGSTVPIAGNAATTTISTCNYGGDYAVTSFTAAGIYTISGSGGTGNFFTVKNAAGAIIYASGSSPLAVNIPTAGTYYIHIGTSGPSSCGTDATCHTVTIVAPVIILPPANDNCSNAILMAVPSLSAGTTINATTESPAPGTCGTTLSQPGVWYKVVGNGNQLGADLCSTSWDSKIFVYSGSCGAWSCVAGDDDGGPMCTGSSASATWCSVPSVTYYILVTGYSSASAFSIAITQTVNSGANPTVTPVASSNSVCAGATATITASGAGSYIWNTGVTTASFAVTPTTTIQYTVYGRAASSCNYDIKTVSVTSVPNTTVSVSANSGSICPGGAFVVNASGATTYTWTGGTASLTGATATLNPIVNTIYTVSGTANGCTSTTSLSPTVSVSTLASPTLVIGASTTAICPGFSSSLTVTGANSYTWTSPASNATAITVSPLATTIYTVSGTGTNVCNGIKTITITVYSLPTITVNSGTICAGKTFTMVPGGASTYTYSSGSNTVAPASNTFYTVSGTNAQGCISATTAVANVTIVPLPVVTAPSGTMCIGTYYFITPSGAATYTYSGGSNYTTPTVTTTYSVTGTSSVGCVSLPALVTVTVYNLPTVTAVPSPSNMAICLNETITFTASGATTYTWNNNTSGSVFTDTPSASMNYSLVGTDVHGCMNSASYGVTVNPLPAVSLASTSTFVCVNGSATLSAAGASTYSWTNNASGASIVVNPSVTTVYGVTGITTFGCTKSVTTAINVNTITLTMTSNTAVCNGKSTSIGADAGSNATYTWNTNAPFANITVTPAVMTTYTVHATDKKFCHHTGVVTVSVNALPTVAASSSRTFMCKGESQTLHATGALTYSWGAQGAGDSIVVTPAFDGPFTYVATGTDVNGCKNTSTITLTVDRCTGINELTSGIKNLHVYPNPNTGLFTVELNNGLRKNIQVIDVTGRIVLSAESNDDKTAVDLNNFANGVYYIRIQSDSRVEMIKMIKQ